MSKQQDLINELKKALAERSTTTTPKITTAIPNTNAVTIPANAKNTTATIAKDDKLKLLEIAIENFKQDLKKIKTTDNHGKIKSMLFYAT
ncbi:MAG: hypothetical protein FJX34_05250, partial [Alphaproteobacteria bacterium]|nr:hypothetical protein [Alphaproteobacteria bacterium]